MRTRLFIVLAALILAAFAPPANAALVAWWPFEGDATDFTGAHNGTPMNGPVYVAGHGGASTQAIQMDGNNQYVRAGGSFWTGTGNIPQAFSIGWWANPATGIQWNQQLTAGPDGGGSWAQFAFHTTDTNAVYVGVDQGSGTSRFTPTQLPANTVTLNNWQYFTFTYDKGSAAFYKDGSLLAAKTGMNTPSAWQGFNIGTNAPATTINGAVDDVAIWNGALSPFDVRRLYNDTITPAQALDTQTVSYKIVAYNADGVASGNTTFAAYLSDLWSGTGSTGIQFAAGAGTTAPFTTTSAAGNLPIRVASSANPADPNYAPDRLHVQASLNIPFTPTYPSPNYYLAAQLTAPPGYVFEYHSGSSTATVTSQYFVSRGEIPYVPGDLNYPGTDWHASDISWPGQGGFPDTTPPYAAGNNDGGGGNVPLPSSSLAGGPWFAGYTTAAKTVPGTQGIWQYGSQSLVMPNVYFDVALRLIPGAWDVITDPVTPPDPQVPGLSARIARVDNNLTTLALAATALTLTPGQTNFNASQVVALSRADLDAGGNFSAPAGLLAGNASSAAANPENYAVRMAGYMQITPGNLTRTFALRGDDEWALSIGGNQYYSNGNTDPPTLLPLTFPAAGYYPFEVLYRNQAGGGLLEVSSALGDVRAFDTTTFAVLGNDAGLPVFQDPTYVAGTTQANSAGTPLVPGAITPVADGFRVQQAYPASHGGTNPTTVTNALSFFADKAILNGSKTNYNVGVVAWDPANPDANLRPRTRLDMQDTTTGQTFTTGNLTPTDAIPIDNYNTSYAVQAGVANDNYVTRMNGLLYIDTPGVRAYTVSTDDGYYLRIGSQVLGTRPGSGGTPAGTANTVYANFTQAGLYPFEFYQYEGASGSGIEIGRGGSTDLLLTSGSRNPLTNGFTTDFTNAAYRTEPVAELRRGADGVNVDGKAFANVPALGMNVPVEHWKLEKRSISNRGLLGQKYNYSGNTGAAWDETRPLIAQEIFFGVGGVYPTFNIHQTDYTGFGFQTNTQGDQIGARYTGYLNVPTTGSYNFQMNTDDVSWIFIDIDGDWDTPGPGYHVFESGEAAPGNQAWTVNWNGVSLTSGLHWVEFRSREYGGGDWNNLYWSGPGIAWGFIDGSYFQVPAGQEYPVWTVLTQGTGTSVGDLLTGDFGNLYTFPYGSSEYLRLSVDIAGLWAIAEGQFLFIPEPTTLVLLGGGLVALARRRKKAAR